ncbi:hypothetical protein [Bacillus sp. B1-b2]|uniref:hypothetical protein n=1 Tax=Bacillus sp. B1-b2 TaxID=2653201 RepID=UPI001D0254B0|nr:hypothetical protein [Bacillus sp. B1-b2]
MFETEKCLIKVLKISDYVDIRNLYTNDEVRKFLGGVQSDNTIKKYLQICLDQIMAVIIGLLEKSSPIILWG